MRWCVCVHASVCVSDTRLLPVPWSHGWPDLPFKASELTIWGSACWYPDLSCIIHCCTYTHAQCGDLNSPFASAEILAQIPYVSLSEPVYCIWVTDITVHCTNWPWCVCVTRMGEVVQWRPSDYRLVSLGLKCFFSGHTFITFFCNQDEFVEKYSILMCFKLSKEQVTVLQHVLELQALDGDRGWKHKGTIFSRKHTVNPFATVAHSAGQI